MSTTKILTTKEHSDISELIKQQTNLVFSPNYYCKQVARYLNEKEIFPFLVGYYDNGLKSIIGCHRWEALPYATITFMMTNDNSSFFSSQKNGLHQCLIKLLETSEKYSIYKFYSAQKERPNAFSGRGWSFSSDSTLNQYHSYTEAVIPKNCTPTDRIYRQILENRAWPYNINIRVLIHRNIISHNTHN